MNMMRVLFVLALAPVAQAAGMEMESRGNPIRKVVNMLQHMQAKITEEGKKAEVLYEEFMCYCKTGQGDLAKSIEEAETKIPALKSGVEEAVSKTAQLEKDLEAHKADREAAEKSMAEATALREKEAADFAKENGEAKTNLAAMDKAVAALSKGMGGSFLQTPTAGVVKTIALAQEKMLDADRQAILAFLSGSQGDGYAPQSGEILGILKTMKDEMAKENGEAVAEEESAKKDYEAMTGAKKKQVAALSKTIEEKLKRVGELGVSVETMKNDLEDTEEALAGDQKFLADLQRNCGTRKGEWEQEKKLRTEELTALAETIKLINDDDALELFKKTLPSSAASSAASFLQVRKTSSSMRARALAALSHRGGKPRAQLDFIALALRGKKVGFGKIIQMIDELVGTLKAEQKADDEKKDYCAEELDKSEDKEKELERAMKDLDTVISEGKESIEALTQEAAALETGIKALDKAVSDATEQRKKENAEYKELMASNSAAKELLLMAQNRLNKFYNPKQYKPEAGAPAFVQVKARARATFEDEEAPPPPPNTNEGYTKKSEESSGVIQMISKLVSDLDMEMTEAETEEKHSQKAYEETMAEAGDKRAQDSKSITDKDGAKAELEASVETSMAEKKSAKKDMMALLKYIHGLHSECDWLMEYYDVRKEARTDEIESLGKAKAVLNGASFSFLQVAASPRRSLRRPA